jgi:hypothetical protein
VRWLMLICVAILMTASAADARRLVISEPPMVRKCPKAKTWNLVMSCLAKHSTPKLTKEVKGAKLVTLMQKSGTTMIDNGVLLYVERNGNWQLGGRFETYGGEYSVLGLSPITVGARSGYRLDLGQASPFTLMVDNVSPVAALLRIRRSMFCNGDSYACPEVTTSCEVTVNGMAWHTFRGTIAIQEGGIVVVDGDRERAGPHCSTTQKIYLGWAQR